MIPLDESSDGPSALPSVTEFSEQGGIHYVLPLRWSLSYALTKAQWRGPTGIRERHKKMASDWDKCSTCPKRCKAIDLDELWDYDHTRHTKTFIGAAFICHGCHWLKSPGFRIKTWTTPMPPMLNPPHIISCLGWSQERVDRLRQRDLRELRENNVAVFNTRQQIQQGKAIALPSPVERIPSPELKKLVRPDQIMVVPWRVNLSGLSIYEYSADEIQKFEQRMYDFAAKRMQSLN
jgi:hypothetical protein